MALCPGGTTARGGSESGPPKVQGLPPAPTGPPGPLSVLRMGEGAARRPAACVALAVSQDPLAGTGDPRQSRSSRDTGRSEARARDKCPGCRPLPATRKTEESDRGMMASSAPGRAKARIRASRNAVSSGARGREQATARAVVMWGRGGGVEGRARPEPRKGEGRKVREGVRAG